MSFYYGNEHRRNSNSLQHGPFKYIKREWKNGKWKYWYEDAKSNISDKIDRKTGKVFKKQADNAKKNSNDWLKDARKQYKKYQEAKKSEWDDYMTARKEVTKTEKNRQYAKKMLPGHMDKADANVNKAKENLKKVKDSQGKLGSDTSLSKTSMNSKLKYARKYAQAAKDNTDAYNRSVAGKAEKASKQVKKAANDVADWATDTYEDVSKKASKAIDDGAKYAKKAANDVADWATDTYEDVSKKASQAIDDGANWVKGLLSGKKKKKKK